MRYLIVLCAFLATSAAARAQDVRASGMAASSINKALDATEAIVQIVQGTEDSFVSDTRKVVTSVVAGGAAVAAATNIGVAATSGAGIATGLAGAGSVVGGGMAAGPAVMAAGPAVVATQVLNNTAFRDDENLNTEERGARSAARLATPVGAGAGVVGVGAVVVAGGTSGPAIIATLAAVGSTVGGGALVGTAILVAAPVVVVGGVGYAVYWVWGGGKKS